MIWAGAGILPGAGLRPPTNEITTEAMIAATDAMNNLYLARVALEEATAKVKYCEALVSSTNKVLELLR